MFYSLTNEITTQQMTSRSGKTEMVEKEINRARAKPTKISNKRNRKIKNILEPNFV